MTIIETAARRLFALPAVTLAGVLQRLVEADARYRDDQHVRKLPDHLLHDVGLHREANGTMSRR